VIVYVAVTETSSEDELPPLDDSYRHARNLVTCHQTVNKGREVVGKHSFASRLVLERRQAKSHEEHRQYQDRPWPQRCYGAL
jgi:hypothetical protein